MFTSLSSWTWLEERTKIWGLKKNGGGRNYLPHMKGMSQLRVVPMTSVNGVLVVGNKCPLSAHQAVERMSSSLLHPQKGKVPQQGCSHGFQMVLNTENCCGTGVRVLRCSLMAASIFLTTESNSASLSGLRSRASEGSLEMSKSSGGSW